MQKIERLKSTLHLVGLSAGNTHTLFVDVADDIENFDAAAHFDTHEDLLQRAANRPRTRTLLGHVCSGVSKKTVDEVRPQSLSAQPGATSPFLFRSTKNATHRTAAALLTYYTTTRCCFSAPRRLTVSISDIAS